MGIEIIRRIGKKTLWLCHTGDLLRQAKKDMENQYPNIKIGLTTAGKLEIGDDVTISTVQTMDKIDPSLYEDEFDMVIVDECAHISGSPTQSKMFQRVINNIKARYKYGLTATPARSDDSIQSMYAYVGLNEDGKFDVTYKVDKTKIKTIISEHRKIDLYSGYDSYNMTKLFELNGQIEYNKLVSTLCENEERNEKILKQIMECHEEGRKQAVLSMRVEHCEQFVNKLNSIGIKAVLCVGKTKDKEREDILNERIDWDVIVSTYALFKEGISIKSLDTMHLTIPINDKSTTVQCAGRIERYMENKKQPIVYDYVDTDIEFCKKKYTNRRRSLKSRF
jgi:superfamily II DNA or RNA helicase